MKITTNVARHAGQVQMVSDIIKNHIGEEVKPTSSIDKGLTLIEMVLGWVNWCNSVPAEERISSKRITTDKGHVQLTFNNLNGSIKLQFRK